MPLRIEKATDAQREAFFGLQERHRNSGEVFDWYYDEKTTYLILKGRAVIDYYGEKTPIAAGDLVIFPKGYQCEWTILEALCAVKIFADGNG